MLHSLLLSLLITPQGAPQAQSEPKLDAMAARIEVSDSPHERVELARLGRRLDKGGSLWWYEVEIRARLSAGDDCEVIRLCDLALENPLEDSDRAVVYWLRAVAFDHLKDEERLIADLHQVLALDPE